MNKMQVKINKAASYLQQVRALLRCLEAGVRA